MKRTKMPRTVIASELLGSSLARVRDLATTNRPQPQFLSVTITRTMALALDLAQATKISTTKIVDQKSSDARTSWAL
jgi:hypothetical protein